MAEFISLETDFDEAFNLIDGLGKEFPKIRRKVLAGIGTTAVKKSKTAYRGMLQKRTGNLYKSIKRSVVKSGKAVVIYPRAKSSNNVAYGFPLAKGSVIRAKDDDYLTFQVNGRWVKKKEVRVPSHDFVEGPINSYLGSKAHKDQMDQIIEKELKRLENKGCVVIPTSTQEI